jgi:tetratricopeptide (TPR) repeat protein
MAACTGLAFPWYRLAAVTLAVFLAAICPEPITRGGDELSSQALTTKAWEKLAAGDLAAALEATAKCQELYAAEAGRQQAALTDFLPLEKGHDAWALNDVGTCLFIEGQAHEKAGRTAEAKAAYRRLVKAYGFAQCWDEKGWFWKPAQAAADRLDVLEFDATLTK